MQDTNLFDDQITFAKDETTAMAKNNTTNAKCVAINSAHEAMEKQVASILQRSRNLGYVLSTAFKRAIQFIKAGDKRVRFVQKSTIATYNEGSKTIIITYDSGADSNCISEQD